MSKSQIERYFRCVQNGLKENGMFACFNRYKKKVKVREKEFFNNYFREYPFDNNWSAILSEPSPIQPTMHLLLVKREKESLRLAFKEKFSELLE